MAFKGAWGFLELSFGYLLGRIVIAWVLLPRHFEGELTTSYALLERKFGAGVRRMASGTFILTRIFADGVRLYATAIPLVIIFRGCNLFAGISAQRLHLAAILGGAVLSMASHGTDYLIVQRLFSTESVRDSRRALVASGVVVILQFALFLAVGTLLFLLYGPLALKGDAVFPKFIVERVPSGLSGLIIAGLLAAAMSTISGSIRSISSSTVFDLHASTKRGRAASEEFRLRLSRRVSFAWALHTLAGSLVTVAVAWTATLLEGRTRPA